MTILSQVEALWNEPLADQPLPDSQGLATELAKTRVDSPRGQMLSELKEVADLMDSLPEPKAAVQVPTTPLQELPKAQAETVLMMIEEAFEKVPMGPFGQALLAGMLEDHPKTVLRWAQDPKEPAKLNLHQLADRLKQEDQAMQRQYEKVLAQLQEREVHPQRKDKDPMAAMTAANHAQMSAMEQVMSDLGDRLASSQLA